jgi:Alpha-L-arabinofuranosidase B, catalytic
MYRLVAGYNGNLIRLRRASDSVEQNFGMTAAGVLDTAATAAFIGGSSALVVTVFNQTGGNDMTQATAADQPQFSAAGFPGSKPAVKHVRNLSNDGLGLEMTDDGVMNFAGNMTWCFQYEPNAINVGRQNILAKGNTTNPGEFCIWVENNTGKLGLDRPFVEAAVVSSLGLTVAASNVMSGDVNSTSVRHFKNAASNGTDTLAVGTATAGKTSQGWGIFTAAQEDSIRGYMRALMLWDSYEPVARAAAETMMINETVAGASAATIATGSIPASQPPSYAITRAPTEREYPGALARRANTGSPPANPKKAGR